MPWRHDTTTEETSNRVMENQPDPFSLAQNKGIVWAEAPKDYKSLARIIEQAYAKNNNKQFDRILIIGHAGLGDGKYFNPGIMLGASEAEGPSKSTARLQYKEGHPTKNMDSLEKNKIGALAIKTALNKALMSGGYLQLSACGYQAKFNAMKGNNAWEIELMEMARILAVKLAVSAIPIGPGTTKISNDAKKAPPLFQFTGQFRPEPWIIADPFKK